MATQGLFMDPQMAGDARLMQLAQMDPNQRLFLQAARGGQQLAQGVGSLFGQDVRDPAVIKATKMRELATKYGVDTAEGLDKIAMELQATDPNMAMQVKAKADELRMQTAKLQSEQALTAQRMREKAAADPFEKLLGTGKYTTDSLAKYKESGNVADLVLNEKSQAFGADAERMSKALFGTSYDKLTPQQADAVNKAMLQQDLLVKATGAPKISVSTQQETAFAKQRGELQAKSLADAETQAKASANAVNRLASMEKLNQGTMLTGPLAGSGIGAGQFLSSLGLLSPDAAKTLSSSEIYDKLAKDLVMQDLGGKLGAQISNADRDFIEARIPQLRNSQQARTELIAKLKEIHKKNIDYYQRMSKYANTKGNLNDFDFASGAPETTVSGVAGTKENPIKLQ